MNNQLLPLYSHWQKKHTTTPSIFLWPLAWTSPLPGQQHWTWLGEEELGGPLRHCIQIIYRYHPPMNFTHWVTICARIQREFSNKDCRSRMNMTDSWFMNILAWTYSLSTHFSLFVEHSTSYCMLFIHPNMIELPRNVTEILLLDGATYS